MLHFTDCFRPIIGFTHTDESQVFSFSGLWNHDHKVSRRVTKEGNPKTEIFDLLSQFHIFHKMLLLLTISRSIFTGFLFALFSSFLFSAIWSCHICFQNKNTKSLLFRGIFPFLTLKNNLLLKKKIFFKIRFHIDFSVLQFLFKFVIFSTSTDFTLKVMPSGAYYW